MARRLIFENRRFSKDSVYAGIGFIWVSLEPKPRPKLGSTDEGTPRSAFIAGLSLRDCQTVADIVASELARRGLRRVRMGSRTYCAIEENVVDDIIAQQLDLGEIAWKIEEAKMEMRCEMSSSVSSRSRRCADFMEAA